MSLKNQIESIKDLMKEKLEIVEVPKNEDECILIREIIVGNNYNVQVAVGKSWTYPNNFNIVGHVFEESSSVFSESTIKIEAKNRPKSEFIFCGVAKKGLVEICDKAKLGFSDDQEWGSLENLIEILEKFE